MRGNPQEDVAENVVEKKRRKQRRKRRRTKKRRSRTRRRTSEERKKKKVKEENADKEENDNEAKEEDAGEGGDLQKKEGRYIYELGPRFIVCHLLSIYFFVKINKPECDTHCNSPLISMQGKMTAP